MRIKKYTGSTGKSQIDFSHTLDKNQTALVLQNTSITPSIRYNPDCRVLEVSGKCIKKHLNHILSFLKDITVTHLSTDEKLTVYWMLDQTSEATLNQYLKMIKKADLECLKDKELILNINNTTHSLPHKVAC